MPHTLNTQASILIIDDEPQIRKFLDIALRAQGYRVQVAENGMKGLEILATRGADLLILDLGLPDMDGHDVLKELRQWSDVPVIVLSARPDENQKLNYWMRGQMITLPSLSVFRNSARVCVSCFVIKRQH